MAAGHIRSGGSKSCGCLQREIAGRQNLSHGGSRRDGLGIPEYQVWKGMHARCCNPRSAGYPNYGGRGIRVCDRWAESFEAFLADMGRRPGPGWSIDRIDNDGNYEPGNCRWQQRPEQNANRRVSVRLTFRGETATMDEWVQRTGIPRSCLRTRLRLGWTVEAALTTPPAPRAKLTPAQVEEIRARYATGSVSMRRLGAEYGVNSSQISQIVNGQAWRKPAASEVA